VAVASAGLYASLHLITAIKKSRYQFSIVASPNEWWCYI